MERTGPTKQYLLDLSGENQGLISSAHHGLYECPSLREVYSHLNFEELFAFVASSWQFRNRREFSFLEAVKSASLYEIFSEAFKIGFPWLRKNSQVSSEDKKHRQLNPFENGRDLSARLEGVPSDSVSRLREQLTERVNEYVFECQYHDRKMRRGGDNYKLEIMRFQNVYPKSGRIVPAFAEEIARIMKTFPREIVS